jgi:DNA-binding NarL/FixJ family response regulator
LVALLSLPSVDQSMGRVVVHPASIAPRPVAEPARLRVAVANHHRLLRDGLRALFGQQPDWDVVGEAATGEEALALVADITPDVLVLDADLPRVSGIDVLRSLAASAARTRVILLLGTTDTSDAVRALQLGARAIMAADSPGQELLQAIRADADGGYWVASDVTRTAAAPSPKSPRADYGLTGREREVVSAVVAAYSNKEIGIRLAISEKTVKHHLTNIFDKVGVSSRLELALFVTHHGVELPEMSA